jgi:site-specific recombinase XerD
MKTKNALVTTNRSIAINPELFKKFEEAGQKRATIDDFIRDFLFQFIAENTKNAYMKDLSFYFDFLRSGGVSLAHPSQIKAFHFQLYRDHLLDRGLSSATINRRLVAIRSFVKWSIASKLMDFNPLDTVKLPKVQTVSPTVAFEDNEAYRMINAPDITTHKGRMNRLAMVLLFNLGLRRNELVTIKMKDIVEDRGHVVLRVHGKGDKTRPMPLNSYVKGEIKRYTDILEAWGITLEADDYLLQTNMREKNIIPVDGSTIYRAIEKYSQALGINKSVSPHSCRATVISHLLDTQHLAIRDVATFAGHSNITTTERYDKRRNNLDNSAAYEVDFNFDVGKEA